jgi:oligopeptide/dipeptide ABC transporter ATP-binding protein
MTSDFLLDVRHLSTQFHTQDGVVKAVDDVSYNVARGETVALVGESGCGKTVSALSIVRLIAQPPGKIVAGEVLFNGQDLSLMNSDDIRRIRGAEISMIFQEPMTALNPVLTIGRQITEALELHLQMTPGEARAEAVRLLKLVGIPNAERRVNEYPHRFSGGMRQRAMIAMAISCRPKLIIADEPTTVVDVTIQAQLLELIRGITRELGTSLILITHNLGIVARYANRVFVMYAGRIVESGPAAKVYRQPCHPYTAGLLASVPRLDEPRKVRLAPIEGQPPDLIAPPAGCGFYDRCRYSCAACESAQPALTRVGHEHSTACCIVAREGETPWQGPAKSSSK